MKALRDWRLKIGPLEPRMPIIQGGMGVGISLAGLASAVAHAGGIGVIATAGIGIAEPDIDTQFRAANTRALARELRKAKAATDGVIGVNIMLALSNADDLVNTAVAEGADVVFLSAGLPVRIPGALSPEQIRNSNTRFVPVISSARAASVILRAWQRRGGVPDALVIEGPMAGGHLGFKRPELDDPAFRLEHILPQVREVVASHERQAGKKISVVVGGGVFTGADVHRFLQMGADGVQMATRFVATHECDADLRFKEAYVRCKLGDLTIIDSPVGLPGRAIRNQFLDDVTSGLKKPFKCPFRCLRTCSFKTVPYCIAQALANARLGHLDDGFAFAGANAHRVERIVSVDELMAALQDEYAAAAAAALHPGSPPAMAGVG